MTATETVDRRTILRYRGEPLPHEVRFYASQAVGMGWADRVLTAQCDCGWHITIEGGHTAAELARLARQHAGLEDPPEGSTP